MYKNIKEKLENERVSVSKKEIEAVCKDRLDFGFDSIYFRYADIRNQLAYELAKTNHDLPQELRKANEDKHRFYNALEQLTHAHEGEE